MARPDGQKDSSYLVGLIASESVTHAHFGPAMLRVVLEEPGFAGCQSLRRVFCGGEPLMHELRDRFFSLSGAELYQQYGPTETTVDVTVWECERGGGDAALPIGRPVANTRAYVLDKMLQPLPVGLPGELYIGGAQLA